MPTHFCRALRLSLLALGLAAFLASLALAAEAAASSAQARGPHPTAPGPIRGQPGLPGVHPTEYANFKAYSKKARSFQSVPKMAHGLTEAELKKCYECHTTGYGEPGGFVSQAQTPTLKESVAPRHPGQDIHQGLRRLPQHRAGGGLQHQAHGPQRSH